MYERVLLPTDGGERAADATRHAVGLAGRYGATLHAVYVVETDTGPLTVSKDEVRDALREVGREAGEDALREVRTLARDAGVDLVTAVLDGKPDEEILRYADENGVDLVVMGTHGRTGLGRRLLGSVAERVVRGATVPVMVVSTAEE